MTRLLRILIPAGAALLLAASPALADHAQPPVDINKMDYSPIGHFKPGDPLFEDYSKSCDSVLPLRKGEIFNPSGKWNSFDNEVFEVYCLPYRNQDDTSANDPMGNGGGETRHGYCNGANPNAVPPTGEAAAGKCPNHQLEYIRYFHATMKEILGEFGGYATTYEFEHSEGIGRNPAYVVPGSDHPDEHILIGSHYDQTKTGPASAWDSQEGHAEMKRVAKIMADYWRSTGTRPSATVKFVPMDAEEDGLLGSEDYVNNTIVPDQEHKVRSYWNADPCAGGYPAFHYGTPHRIDMGIQVGESEDPRVVAFNETVEPNVTAVLDRLDDKLESHPAQVELFVGPTERPVSDLGTEIFIGTDKPVLFGSDWANFIALNIPFFNPGPEVTGPNAPGEEGPQGNVLGTPEGVYQFHTPLDNLNTMNRYTGGHPSGNQFSEGWIKGMEFCAFMLAHGMLQPDAGGTQAVNADPVAFFEALPNEGEVGRFVNFDGTASYQYADPATRAKVEEARLRWKWEFGDGVVAYGPKVKHSYKRTGVYQAKLTLSNRTTGATDTMEIPVTIVEGNGTDVDPAEQAVDRANLPDGGNVVPCQSEPAFKSASVKPAGKGLRFSFSSSSPNPVIAEVFQVAKGRRVTGKAKRVYRAEVTSGARWKGSGKVKRGSYFARLSTSGTNSRRDVRTFALDFTNRFKARKRFMAPPSCDTVGLFALGSPVFGSKGLAIAFSVVKPMKVTITVRKGSKKVKTFRRNVRSVNRAQRLRLPGRRLRRGEYKVTLKAGRKTLTLYARKL